MESEAAFRLGEVRIEELRAAIGRKLLLEKSVFVSVPGSPGEAPVTTEVAILRVRAGRGEHARFACPGCGRPVRRLHTHRGQLRCTSCANRRTQQQRRKRTRAWRMNGELQGDRLLRLLLRWGDRNTIRATTAACLAVALVRADHDRLRELGPLVRPALDFEGGR